MDPTSMSRPRLVFEGGAGPDCSIVIAIAPIIMSEATTPEYISVLSSLIEKVLTQALETASHSWEYGVVFEALLEYHSPSLTVFHGPVSQHQQHLRGLTGTVQALEYIKPFIRTDNTTLCEGHGKIQTFHYHSLYIIQHSVSRLFG